MRHFIAIFFLIGLLSCKNENQTEEKLTSAPQLPAMDKTYIDPAQGYSQAVVVASNGIKTIYVSGQVGEGENFEAQLRDAIAKLLKTLKNSGASFDDVVKYTTYVVDYQPEYLDTFRTVRKELLGDTDMSASTLIGVPSLGLPQWGVEIEAIAVIQPLN